MLNSILTLSRIKINDRKLVYLKENDNLIAFNFVNLIKRRNVN